jgi:lycopene beta-cyclase
VFGGEFLMKQNVVGLRGFFDGFFRLPVEQWAGFLAGWPGLPNNDKHETWLARMLFGINFIVRLPPPVAVDMFLSIVSACITGRSLLQSVTPFFGEPNSYNYKRNTDYVGDVAVKQEAKLMIKESQVSNDLPVAFGEDDPNGNKQASTVANAGSASLQ